MKNSSLTEAVNLLAIDNSEASYKILFNYLFNPLKEFLFCLLKLYKLVKEIASGMMFLRWQCRTDLLLVGNLYAYAFITTRNLSLIIIKNNTISIDDISIDIFLNNDTPEQILIGTGLRSKIENAVNRLPPKCKLVFKLIKEGGLSYKDVAKILRLSVKKVDAHLVSAIKRITRLKLRLIGEELVFRY